MFPNIKTNLLRLDELFVCAIKIFIKNFRYILTMTLLTIVPIYIIQDNFFDLEIFQNALLKFSNNTASTNELNIIQNGYILISGLFALFSFIIVASIAYIVKQETENKAVSFSGIFDSSILKWGRHFYTNLLFITLISIFLTFNLLGAFFCIYFGIHFIFYIFIIATTKVSGFKSFSISKKIIQGHFLKTLLLLLLILIFQVFFTLLSVFAISFIEMNIVISFIVELILNLLNCISIVMLAIWFFNLAYVKKISEILT